MANQKLPLIIGNWKMNPLREADAISLSKSLATNLKKISGVNVVIVPPLLFIPAVAKTLVRSTIKLGVQHTSPGPVGPFTGEVSPAMCVPYGVTHCIIGHSERRARGESDASINSAVLMLLKQKMTPIICVGERERDDQANFYSVVETQVTKAFASIPTTRYKDVVIAYEPVWAIGTGATATAADVLEMKLFIQKVLTKLGGRTGAAAVTIIYGGSVSTDNAHGLYHEGQVQGFLVGGASLDAESFAKIIASTTTK